MKKPTAAQTAWRKEFAKRAKAGTLKKGAKKKAKKPAKKKPANVGFLPLIARAVIKRKIANKVASSKGLSGTISGATRKYVALYESGRDLQVEYFRTTSLREAKALAVLHKKRSPTLKGTRVKVKLSNS